VEIDIVLPCLNEVQALPCVLDLVPSGTRAIVVDNGSNDGSAEVARSHGAVVVECRTRGYGAACNAGLHAATAPYVAFCDCDGSLDPRDVLRLVSALRLGADLAICRRRPTTRAAMSRASRLANLELARRVRNRCGAAVRDVGPMRAARRSALLELAVSDRRSGYPVETVVRAARAGWQIVQLDVDYHPRIGASKVTGTARGYLTAIRDSQAALAR
jgi:glycosyltransferase involved in cell wall biosynthesis